MSEHKNTTPLNPTGVKIKPKGPSLDGTVAGVEVQTPNHVVTAKVVDTEVANSAPGRWDRAMRRVTHGPRRMADKARRGFNDKTEVPKHKIKEGVDKVKGGLNKTGDFIQGFGKANGFGGKAKYLGGKIGNKAKNNLGETIKNIKRMFEKIKQTVMFVASHIKVISIITGIVALLYGGTIFVISIMQSATPTPHYYCDTDATRSVKKTAVYQQYCVDGNGFELENLQGHYIIQDGSGPCTDCANLNLLLRFYSASEEINFFDYLWREDGTYGPEGQTVQSDVCATGTTVRHIINGNSPDSSTKPEIYHSDPNQPDGTQAFAKAHGKSWPPNAMPNWGYLRDDSLDISTYDMDDSIYINNAGNENWVWDLSLDNRAPGTTWAVYWDHNIKLDGGLPCKIVSVAGNSSITGETIKDILHQRGDYAFAYGPAGVLLYYDRDGDGDGNHAILITGYDEDTGYWRVIDSAMDTAGGFEGPLDGSGNFAISEVENDVKDLLNSGNNKNGIFGISRISYVSIDFFN